jgi:hypothetical protein
VDHAHINACYRRFSEVLKAGVALQLADPASLLGTTVDGLPILLIQLPRAWTPRQRCQWFMAKCEGFYGMTQLDDQGQLMLVDVNVHDARLLLASALQEKIGTALDAKRDEYHVFLRGLDVVVLPSFVVQRPSVSVVKHRHVEVMIEVVNGARTLGQLHHFARAQMDYATHTDAPVVVRPLGEHNYGGLVTIDHRLRYVVAIFLFAYAGAPWANCKLIVRWQPALASEQRPRWAWQTSCNGPPMPASLQAQLDAVNAMPESDSSALLRIDVDDVVCDIGQCLAEISG